MNYIVFDLEWNQGPHRSEPHEEPTFEIIEIGAMKLDAQFQVLDIYQSLIKPQLYDEMHRYTAEIVDLDMRELVKERCFVEVAEEFFKWCGEDYIFCIWGVQDLTELQKNMDYYEMKPLSRGPMKFYDVQKLYSIACEDGKTRTALSNVVQLEDMLEERVPFHRAFGDAYYTARILQRFASKELLKRVSFDTYRIPNDLRDQIFWKFEDYTKFISQGFDEKSQLMANKTVSCVKCIYCDKALSKKISWYTTNNGKHYHTVAKCSEHGMMKGKIRVRKDKDDKYFAIKTIKQISEAEADIILSKKRH